MIYLMKELLNKGETEYSVKHQLANGDLFLAERGVYSDEPNAVVNEVFICKKYPNAIITGLSAFYIYDLTDYVPDSFHVATLQHAYPIQRKDVSQSYQDPSFFLIGKIAKEFDGGYINIYDLERMLIELIRLKEKYPQELYYDVLNNFRKIKNKLDFYKINKYAKYFKNGRTLLKKIKEVI